MPSFPHCFKLCIVKDNPTWCTVHITANAMGTGVCLALILCVTHTCVGVAMCLLQTLETFYSCVCVVLTT